MENDLKSCMSRRLSIKNQPALTAAISIVNGLNSYYPMDEDEGERRKKRKDHDQNQDLHY